jgi:sporulation protein YabP
MEEKSVRGEARTLGMPGTNGGTAGQGRHSLQVINREQALVQGVLAVESFDDEQIMMETDMGGLTIKGQDLHIKQLDLDSGHFAVDGFITSCVYSTPRQRGGRQTRGRSFLERLLK